MNAYAKIGCLLRCARLTRQLSTAVNKQKNFYELLGVSPKATAAEIKNAYFEKTKLYHPDAVTPTDESLSLFRQISEAYEVLGSPKLRKEYDKDVLGMWEEDEQNVEDPIASYRRKMADVRTYSWTKEHYNTLRRQQYTYNSPLHNKPKAKAKAGSENTSLINSITVVVLLIFLIAFNMNVFDYKKEKMQT